MSSAGPRVSHRIIITIDGYVLRFHFDDSTNLHVTNPLGVIFEFGNHLLLFLNDLVLILNSMFEIL